MESIGMVELETRLADVLRRVEGGEHVVVTRHGVPVAKIVPPDAAAAGGLDVVERIKSLRARQQPLGWETLRSWRDEDRR